MKDFLVFAPIDKNANVYLIENKIDTIIWFYLIKVTSPLYNFFTPSINSISAQ